MSRGTGARARHDPLYFLVERVVRWETWHRFAVANRRQPWSYRMHMDHILRDALHHAPNVWGLAQKVSRESVRLRLDLLEQDGLVKRNGSGRNAKWSAPDLEDHVEEAHRRREEQRDKDQRKVDALVKQLVDENVLPQDWAANASPNVTVDDGDGESQVRLSYSGFPTYQLLLLLKLARLGHRALVESADTRTGRSAG